MHIKTRKHEGLSGLQVGWVYPYSRSEKISRDYQLSAAKPHIKKNSPDMEQVAKKKHESNSSLRYFPHAPTVEKRAPTITSHFYHLITKKSPSTLDMTQSPDGALGIAHVQTGEFFSVKKTPRTSFKHILH